MGSPWWGHVETASTPSARSGGTVAPTNSSTPAQTQYAGCRRISRKRLKLSARSRPSREETRNPMTLFENDGANWYRMPSLVATPSAVLIAACDQRKGSRDDHGQDTDVLMRRSTDDGLPWDSRVCHPRGSGRLRRSPGVAHWPRGLPVRMRNNALQ